MKIRIPSNSAAALAGVWFALGVVPFAEFMLTHAPSNGRRLLQVAWVIFFFLLPFRYLVVGATQRDPSSSFFERVRQGWRGLPPGGALRAVCWVVAAASTLAVVRVFWGVFRQVPNSAS